MQPASSETLACLVSTSNTSGAQAQVEAVSVSFACEGYVSVVARTLPQKCNSSQWQVLVVGTVNQPAAGPSHQNPVIGNKPSD